MDRSAIGDSSTEDTWPTWPSQGAPIAEREWGRPRVRASLARSAGIIAGAQPPSFPADAGHAKLPAAWLIERAGFRRGESDGNVGISTKHTLAIVNRGGATARDVLRFAARIKRAVLDRFGISLRPEPVFVGFGRNHDLEFLTDVQSPD